MAEIPRSRPTKRFHCPGQRHRTLKSSERTDTRFEVDVDPVDRLDLEEVLGHDPLTPEYRELTTVPGGDLDGEFRIGFIEKDVLAPSEQVLFYVGDRHPPRYIYAFFIDNYGQVWVRDAFGTLVECTDQHREKIRTGEPLFD
ncbi:hypothetical protein ABZ814_21225 [Micromonospora musae]|uniref:hypothetical protein n=1 Tax=Micromonospora musae TaxID=1894970 RepID=UPI0033ED1861